MSVIRVLENSNNRRGDLFGRLMADLFLALGYEQPRMNVHKSGRELDLVANHRLETRLAVGECKATAAPIGGDDLNKFVGVVDAEYGDSTTPVTGYFISLSGFRETAVEQESKRRRTKIILLDAAQVVSQLIQGNMIKPAEHATELAGRCCPHQHHLFLESAPELLAHERGLIWAVHYTQGKARTHVALIHADGTPLALPLAREIIASDQACDGTLYTLTCLNPPPFLSIGLEQEKAACAAYAHYINEECGHILLDGLPADGEVGSRRLRLENLFVPLHLNVAADGPAIPNTFFVEDEPSYGVPTPFPHTFSFPPPMLLDIDWLKFPPTTFSVDEMVLESPPSIISSDSEPSSSRPSPILRAKFPRRPVAPPPSREAWSKDRTTIGSMLEASPRLALLAAPGGGKSTLLKRLAVAYADTSRRPADLPATDWLPLFFRCRELRTLARASFAELLHSLSQREPVRQHAAAFRALADRALSEGRVLLLVDGLDEIPDAGDRAAFVCTLRTAIQAYPGTALVITSREAGFRHVASHLSAVCTQATLAPFDAEDIRHLCVAWHAEVVGSNASIRTEAEELAVTIASNDRIRRIAVNPLLLTTLLLVRRWVGSLPTRRAVLYGKAVEVLLMTWNTEGHEPIPEEEALPQLCYVASAMMMSKVERISRPRIAAILREARDALPTELGYVKGTVADFIQRVEDRSSLLMMTGLDVEDGRLVEFYEFRHLTFQEFLAARAMAEGWHPGRRENDTLAVLLEPHFDDDKWQEVIPLAASLGGRATEGLIQALTLRQLALQVPTLWPHEIRHCGAMHTSPLEQRLGPSDLLGRCLADEAAASPRTIRAAVKALVPHLSKMIPSMLGPACQGSYIAALVRGRYGADLLAEARLAAFTPMNIWTGAAALMTVTWWQTWDEKALASDQQNKEIIYQSLHSSPQAMRLVELLHSADRLDRCGAALALGTVLTSWNMGRVPDQPKRLQHEEVNLIFDAIIPLLQATESLDNYAALYLLLSIEVPPLWRPKAAQDILGLLFILWRRSPLDTVRKLSLKALLAYPAFTEEAHTFSSTIPWDELYDVLRLFDTLWPDEEKIAALVIAWHTRTLPLFEITRRAKKLTVFSSVPYPLWMALFRRNARSGLAGLLRKLEETADTLMLPQDRLR